MISLELKNLFPTPVMFGNLGREFTEKEIAYFQNLEIVSNNFNLRSENSYILNSEPLTNLKVFLESCVKKYFFEIYKPLDDIDIYITQSWINISRVGEQHHIHSHPNSFISGTLYISADKEVDQITFSKTDYSTIKLIPTSYNTYNSSSWSFNISSGDVVLFPSTLQHYVDPVKDSSKRNERISLSFNSFLKGNIGSEKFLSELKL